MPFNSEDEIKREREKMKLTDEEFEENLDLVFKELVLSGDASPNDNPTFIMVGGQAGSGKSTLVSQELRAQEHGAIIIDQDLLRTKHPRYPQIYDLYTEREEFLLLKRYLDRLINGIIDRAEKSGYNIILESALRSVSKFIVNIQDLKQKGYTTKLSILAVNPDEANLSMFQRFCYFLELDGECRRNTNIDDDSVKKIPENIEQMDRLNIFDDITISVRGDESTDFMPIQVYSKRKTPNLPPVHVYNIKINEKRIPENELDRRYTTYRAILERFNQTTQISRLDQFYLQAKSRLENSKRNEEAQHNS